jgi:tRNA threonylcarbamoyladenosine biosynthesis protein TsaB
MPILALDTSTDWISAALFDGRTASVLREHAGSASSERILPLVSRVLAEANASLHMLDGIAYGAGPGSFTGVRIACGVVQGLAFGAQLPVVGVSTLGAVAHAAWRAHGWSRVVACLDARMREVYVASYVHDASGWTQLGEPDVRRPDDVALADDGGWHGAGDGLSVYPALVERLGLTGADAAIIPDAQAIAELAWPSFTAGQGTAAAHAQPLYVRHRIALTTAERAAGMRL